MIRKGKLPALLLIPLLLLSAAGCRKEIRSELPYRNIEKVPDSWSTQLSKKGVYERETLLDLFKHDELKKFVKESMKNNYDLKATLARLEASGYLLKAKAGEFLPAADLSLSHTRHNQEVNETTLKRGNGKIYKAGVDISWDFDIWQRIGDEYAAGRLNHYSNRKEMEKFRDSLAAKIIQFWLRTVVSKKLINNLTLQAEKIRNLEKQFVRKYSSGLLAQSHLLDIQQKMRSTESSLITANEQYKRDLRILEVLGGEIPKASLETGTDLPGVTLIKSVFPAEVIKHRPDIQSSIAKLKAAGAMSRAAGKRMLPSLTLRGSAGKEGKSFKLFRGADILWSLISSLTQPLFAGGRLLAEYKAQKAEAKSALWNLEGAVLNALREVEDTLGREKELGEQMNRTGSALKSQLRKSEYYKERYKLGLEDSVNMIMAQIDILDLKNQYNEQHLQLLMNRVDLALAMGKGVYKRGGVNNGKTE